MGKRDRSAHEHALERQRVDSYTEPALAEASSGKTSVWSATVPR